VTSQLPRAVAPAQPAAQSQPPPPKGKPKPISKDKRSKRQQLIYNIQPLSVEDQTFVDQVKELYKNNGFN
jgi:hypothetical protein